MRHKFLTAAIGLALAAALVPLSATSAQAGDPTGYWRKAEQGKFPAKQQIYRCGSRSICVKIAWLKNPRDSKGRALQDVRNANSKLRGRTIEGLQLVRGMAQVGSNQWKGNIYNPEDGNTYSATITMASSNKLILKGCKASIFCRSQVWLRTSAPPPKEEVPEETQIEASAEPAPTTATAAAATTGSNAFANAEMLTPTSEQGAQAGYRYLNASSTSEDHAGFSGENVTSMFSMATPIAPDSTQGASAAAAPKPMAAPSAVAQPQPAAQSRPVAQPSAVAQPKPRAQPEAAVAATPEPAPAPSSAARAEADAASAMPDQTQTAESEGFPQAQERLSRRERRQLRRQQKRAKDLQAQGQGLIPWLR